MSVYVCSDLHGCLDIYKQIKAFLKPEDKVYFLGDAGDRGPDPWETIKAVARDPQFIYIKGNHEDMLWKALDTYLTDGYIDYEYYLLANNGGAETFRQAAQDDAPVGWKNWLKKLPEHEVYYNTRGQIVHLSHAGFTPWKNEDGSVDIPKQHDLIWNRDHFLDSDENDPWADDVIVVHGHTPIPYLLEELNINEDAWEKGMPFWYADFRKVCVDTGTVWLKEATLLNLDTWESYTFTNEEI